MRDRVSGQPSRLGWSLALSVLVYVGVMMGLNLLWPPQDRPYMPGHRPSIWVSLLDPDRWGVVQTSERSREIPDRASDEPMGSSSPVIEARALHKAEAAAASSPPQTCEVAPSQSFRPPATAVPNSHPPPRHAHTTPAVPREEAAPMRTPARKPLAECAKAAEPILPQAGDHRQPPDHSSEEAPALPGAGQRPRMARVPLLNGEDLGRYAQLPAGDPRRTAKPLGGADTVMSPNTKDMTYLAYFAHLKHKIDRVWGSPWDAVAQQIQGCLRLLFVLERSGQATMAELLRSSGSNVLDQVAWEAVMKASPFDPFPPHLRQEDCISGHPSGMS